MSNVVHPDAQPIQLNQQVQMTPGGATQPTIVFQPNFINMNNSNAQANSNGNGGGVSFPVISVFGHYPTMTTCSFCRQTVLTNVTYRFGCYTWTLFIVLLFLGFGFGMLLCFVPFCVKSCHDAEHSCPVCRNKLGIHKKC